MSESTVAAVVGDVEKALAPEAQAALQDVHEAATAELDNLRAKAPQIQADATSHVQSFVDEMIGAYHRLLARVEQHLGIEGGTVPAQPVGPTPSAAASTPATESVSTSTGTAASPSSSSASPSPASPSTTEASSPASSAPAESASPTSTPAAEAPAQA